MKGKNKINLNDINQTADFEKILDLPVLEHEEEIKELIRNNTIAIIIGNTGSGKTTEIARMMSEIVNGKIATTQPRRPAAITVAEYVASKKSELVGESVGYHVRFNDTTTKGTVLDYVTDGILIEQLISGQTLPEYSGIILDEAHIRNLNVDFLMGLILTVNEERRKRKMQELKVLVTSATIPAEKFSEFFGGAPVLEIPGKMYPVQVYYEKERPRDYIQSIAKKVKKVVNSDQEGDILIFVPGEAEIRQTIASIKNQNLDDLEILPFFGQQSLLEQEKVFLKYPGKRKVVIATNIAETSLTIDGVRVVIDAGLQRSSIYDHKTGISRLEDEEASMAAINQRKGRAGRTAPGVCYRIYDEQTPRPEFDVPEILRTDLAGTVLKMKRLGIQDVINFKFIDQPKAKSIQKAINTLKILGALDDAENITGIGQIMANLPLDPHISRMVVEANRFGCVDAICTIAAFMSCKSVFDRSTGDLQEIEAVHRSFKLNKKGEPLSDQETSLNIWDQHSKNIDNLEWPTANFLNPKVLQEVQLIRQDLIQTLRRHRIDPTSSTNQEHIAKSVAAGSIGNLLERINREEYRRMYGNGEGITIHPSSALRLGPLPRYIVAGEIMTNAAGYTGAFQCEKVELEWIPEIGSQILHEQFLGIEYNSKQDEVQEIIRYHLKNDGRPIATQTKIAENSEKAVKIFVQHLVNLTKAVSAKTLSEFNFLKNIKDLEKQILDLHVRSNGQIQEFKESSLAEKFTEKLLPFGITSKKSLKEAIKQGKIDLEFTLEEFISKEKQAKILEKNPDRIEINNKKYKVFYYKNKRKFYAGIEIPIEGIIQLEEVPILPGRDKKSILIKLTGTNNSHPALPVTEFNNIKEIAVQEIVLNLWKKAIENGVIPADKILEIDPKSYAENKLPDLPQNIIFAKHPITQENLEAVPAIAYDRRKKYFKVSYYPDKNRAKQTQDNAMREFNKKPGK